MSFLWPSWLKQNSAVTSPVEAAVLAVINAGQEQPVFDFRWDLSERFPLPFDS